MSVCKAIDEFLRDKVIWVVHLNNGETIYQDDGREGEAEPSAWIRLRQYVTANNLRIERMELVFRVHSRGNVVEMAPNADGYYFAYGALAQMGTPGTHSLYVTGHLWEGRLCIQKWSVPALEQIEEEVREPDLTSLSLIVNP